MTHREQLKKLMFNLEKRKLCLTMIKVYVLGDKFSVQTRIPSMHFNPNLPRAHCMPSAPRCTADGTVMDTDKVPALPELLRNGERYTSKRITPEMNVTARIF